nr:26S proteasome non-ATPase regulatory subunit 4 [Tanacetum cinerariifolium]
MEQIDKQQSISKTEAEVTVICVDNTALVTECAGVYIAQAMAIALYCDEKIKAHPDNMVALVPMGPLQGSSYARPTRDLDEILFALKG